MTPPISLAPYLDALEHVPSLRWTGQVTDVAGLLVESRGPAAAIGDFCEVAANGRRQEPVDAGYSAHTGK